MKKCPFCGEEIQKIAKKCRYCYEWLDHEDGIENTRTIETSTNINHIVDLRNHDLENKKNMKNNKSTRKGRSNNAGEIIINILRYIGFIALSYIAIWVFHILIGLLLAMFASLSIGWLIVLVIFLGSLFFGIRGLLATGIGYATVYLFRLVPNKKAGRVIFIITIILLTIDKIVMIWSQMEGTPNIIRVIYTILIILLCVLLSIGLKDLTEIE